MSCDGGPDTNRHVRNRCALLACLPCRFGRPKGANHLLQRHELASLFGAAQGFEVLRDDVAHCREGRELCMFVARKLPVS